MWERLTPADLDRAKNRLTKSRAEMLRRHTAELNALDAQQDEIETLERLVATFAQKYLSSDIAASMLAAEPPLEQANPAVAFETEKGPAKEVQQKAISVDLRVQQEISSNFGTPPRMRRLIGG